MHGGHFNRPKSMIFRQLRVWQVVCNVSCWHQNVDRISEFWPKLTFLLGQHMKYISNVYNCAASGCPDEEKCTFPFYFSIVIITHLASQMYVWLGCKWNFAGPQISIFAARQNQRSSFLSFV